MLRQTLLVLIITLLSFNYGFEVTRGTIGDKLYYFVHGDSDAKMSHNDAQKYCISLSNKTSTVSNNVTTKAPKEDILKKTTMLASIHSLPENLALIKWVERYERRSFWIGGIVTKQMNEYNRPIYILHWTDGSKANFSFLKLPSKIFHDMNAGEQRCLSVDFKTGQWGLHLCDDKRYFICLSVAIYKSKTKPTASPVARERHVFNVKALRNLLQ